MIVRARSLVTMHGVPIADGAVAVAGKRIVDVGAFADVRRRNAGDVRDLGEHTLLPGLINAHCHLDYTGLRGGIARSASFAAWVRAINERKAALTPDDYVRAIHAGFAEAARFGTTSLANLEAFPELLPRLSPAPLRTWWFAELIDLRGAISPRAVYEQMRVDLENRADRRSRIGLAPHAPFTASANLYRESAAVGRSENVRLTTHLAESRDEMEMFRDARGSLFDLLETIGRPMSDCGFRTPIAAMLAHNILDDRWLVAHVNEIAEGDFTLLAASPRFHIVHCPRSHAFFGHAPFPLARLRALGFNVCLGTDSLASNADLSLFHEMRQLARAEPSLRPDELLEMVTIRAAEALGQGAAIGQLQAGFSADMIAIPNSAPLGGAAEEIVAFEGEVPWLMIEGEEQTRR